VDPDDTAHDGGRFVPPVEPFPATRLNVPDPLRVPQSTTTQAWIGVAWVLGVLVVLPVLAYVVYLVFLFLAREHA
jgi:hypothetical protein